MKPIDTGSRFPSFPPLLPLLPLLLFSPNLFFDGDWPIAGPFAKCLENSPQTADLAWRPGSLLHTKQYVYLTIGRAPRHLGAIDSNKAQTHTHTRILPEFLPTPSTGLMDYDRLDR